MSNILIFSEAAQLSFASYATLSPGRIVGTTQLTEVGMTLTQASEFASKWQVVDQYNESNGLSATIFEPITGGMQFLAVRGTELNGVGAAALDLGADYILALGFPAQLNGQYISLSAKVRQWLAEGKLASQFYVSGHSLGGYLAGAIGISFQSYVSAVYTYNAPGIGGAWVGGAYQALKQFLGLDNLSILSNTYNLRGSRGLSLIAGLGAQLAPPIAVETEGAQGLGLDNHSIRWISDSLAAYSLLSEYNHEYSISEISKIIAAASNRGFSTLERAIDPLARVLGVTSAVIDSRESLYKTIDSLQIARPETGVPLRIASTLALSEKSLLDLALNVDGISYRYALKKLDPYAVIGGDEAVWDRLNADRSLNLDDEGDGFGVTRQYLGDRASMLLLKNRIFLLDRDDSIAGDSALSYKYIDKSGDGVTEGDFTLVSVGRQISSVANPVLIIFGGGASETLSGGGSALGDHLFGGAGNDKLYGEEGQDYLEGDLGDDTLVGGLGDDMLVGGSGFDTYIYDEGDGFDSISDDDGSGKIVYNGRQLTGGTKVGEGMYKDGSGLEYLFFDSGDGSGTLFIADEIYIEDFDFGDLGLNLEGETPVPVRPEGSATTLFQGDDLPAAFNSNDLGDLIRNAYGSMGDDLYSKIDQMTALIARSGNDVVISDSGTAYGLDIDMGAGDDLIDASAAGGSVLSAKLIGGAGNDYISGGAGNDRIWGDNYRAVHQTTASSDYFEIDGFVYNSGPTTGAGAAAGLPTGYGAFTAPFRYPSTFSGYSSIDLSTLTADGTVFTGTLEGAIKNVIGTDAGFDDYIDAGDGADFVVGGSGSDFIYGGPGNDNLWGDYNVSISGAPSQLSLQQYFGDLAPLFGRPGDDYIDGGTGNDTISDQDGGNDVLIGGEGNDTISSLDSMDFVQVPGAAAGAHNVVFGDAGDDNIDVVNVTGGFDVVDGGDGDDHISVTATRYTIEDDQGVTYGAVAGRAFVTGGAGDDVLTVFADDGHVDGGAGNDEYTVSGASIQLSDSSGDDTLHANVLFDTSWADAYMASFPAESSGVDQKFSVFVARQGGDLLLAQSGVVDGGEEDTNRLLISNWFAGAGNRIEHIVTGDGATLSPEQFETWGGFHVGGTGAEEFVEYSDYTDRVFAGGGDDLVFTGEGDDRIYGGTGNDELYGGSGDDVYYFALGDGEDIVFDSSGFDEIRFGPGISIQDVTASEGDSGIVLSVGEDGIGIYGASYFDPGIEQLHFADGSSVALTDLLPVPEAPPFVPDSADADPGTDTGNPDPSGVGADPNTGGSGDASQETAASASNIASPAAASGEGDISADLHVGPSLNLNGAGALAQEDAGTNSQAGSQSRAPVGQRAPGSAPLELQTLLDAMDAFDAAGNVPTGGSGTQGASSQQSGFPPEAPVPSHGALSSLALTNALLQFHLQQADASGVSDGAAEWYPTSEILAGGGLSVVQSFGNAAYGRQSQGLPTFAGLQEGLARLT